SVLPKDDRPVVKTEFARNLGRAATGQVGETDRAGDGETAPVRALHDDARRSLIDPDPGALELDRERPKVRMFRVDEKQNQVGGSNDRNHLATPSLPSRSAGNQTGHVEDLDRGASPTHHPRDDRDRREVVGSGLALRGGQTVEQRRLADRRITDEPHGGVAAFADRIADAPTFPLGSGFALESKDRDLRLETPNVKLRRLVVGRVADLVLDRDDLFFKGRHADRGELHPSGAFRLLESDAKLHRSRFVRRDASNLPRQFSANVFPPSREPRTIGCLATWQLTPHPLREHRGEELAMFRDRLVASLRAGHALGVAFALAVPSGPGSSPTLESATPSSARWVARVLSPAYGRASWVRRPPRPVSSEPRALWGRRVRSWPEPLREPQDIPSASESLALVLGSVERGFQVRWEFSPFPASWNRTADHEDHGVVQRPAPPGQRTRGPPPTYRRWEPPANSGQMPLFWKVRVRLARESGHGNRSSENRVLSSVEVALHSGRGNGVRFGRHRLHLSPNPPWFAVSEDELACILPGVDGQGAAVDPAGIEGLPILPLGRTATGRVVGPPVENDQGRHLTLLGETGMGKSSTLVAIARKASALGGVVLFDPLGETARSFCSGFSPEERSRVVCVSPQEKACGINALEGVAGNATDPVLGDRRLNDLVHALRRVRSGRYTDSSYWGPRLEEMLTRAVSAAAAFPGGTLSDAHTLLAT